MFTKKNPRATYNYKFLRLTLCLLLACQTQISAQDIPEYDLECMSATNDWFVHLNVYQSQLEMYTTSIWTKRKEYLKGEYTFNDSTTYKSKEITYNQNCYEVNDNMGVMMLRYCMVVDDKFYKEETLEDEKIQEMYKRGYEFGMGEIEFYKVPSPVSSGTLFYCFQKKMPSSLHFYCK